MRKNGLRGCDSQCHRKRHCQGREDAKGRERSHWIEGSSVTDVNLDIDESVATVKHIPTTRMLWNFLSHR